MEVRNTDAEGRLCLADALSFLQAEYRPHTVVDLATLTGACAVALGEYAGGLFSNSAELGARLQRSGRAVQERLWPLPIFAEHDAELRGAMADLHSTGKGRTGGAR